MKKNKECLVKCNNCGYEWETKSKLNFVTCPSCQKKIRNIKVKIAE